MQFSELFCSCSVFRVLLNVMYTMVEVLRWPSDNDSDEWKKLRANFRAELSTWSKLSTNFFGLFLVRFYLLTVLMLLV